MDIDITGRGVAITDRFREYVLEKSEKISHLAERALVFEVKLSRQTTRNGQGGDDRVELTLVGPGPVVRAEALASDKYAALDIAIGRLLERVRRAKDRRKVHRGGHHRPTSLHDASSAAFAVTDLVPASAETLQRVRTGAIPIVAGSDGAVPTSAERAASANLSVATGGTANPDLLDTEALDAWNAAEHDGYCPVVIRQKTFASTPMTVDDALYYMELVGHDFYLFIEASTGNPSVVYRRKGWDYGVISLDEGADELQEAVTAAKKMEAAVSAR